MGMENLKHRLEDDTGGRMIVDKASAGDLAALSGMGSVMCEGDQAVALQQFAGGAKSRGLLGVDNKAECIDAGAHGDATPFGQPYSVFELSLPRSVIDCSLVVDMKSSQVCRGVSKETFRKVAL